VITNDDAEFLRELTRWRRGPDAYKLARVADGIEAVLAENERLTRELELISEVKKWLDCFTADDTPKHLTRIAGEWLADRAELERLRGMVGKTRDGKYAPAGTEVWHPAYRDSGRSTDATHAHFFSDCLAMPMLICECYSTREAALAAKGETK
jgi:hypothetical protein